MHYCRPGCNVRSHFTNITEHGSPIAYCAGSDRQPADPAVGFADANFTRVSDELRKPISGYCFFLYFFFLVCWRSKLQTATAQSTHEAELIAVALASNELIWICEFIVEIGFFIPVCTPIARPEVTGPDHDLPGIDTMTDFRSCLKKKPVPLVMVNSTPSSRHTCSMTTKAPHRQSTT